MNDELKTLKDIGWDDSGFGDYLYTKDVLIRELGIKWIKKLQTEKILLSNETIVKIEGIWFSFGMLSGASVILKKIFDISEEDLQ